MKKNATGPLRTLTSLFGGVTRKRPCHFAWPQHVGRDPPVSVASGFYMKLVYSLAAELVSSRAAHGSASARRLGADMCKELKTKVLRLLPPTSNGPAVNQAESRTGER